MQNIECSECKKNRLLKHRYCPSCGKFLLRVYSEETVAQLRRSRKDAEIIRMLTADGYSIKEIEKLMNIAYQNIISALKLKSVEINLEGIVFPNIQKWMYENGVRKSDMARLLGIEYRPLIRFLGGKSKRFNMTWATKILMLTGMKFDKAFERAEVIYDDDEKIKALDIEEISLFRV